jgi:hypothetical protein
MATNINLINVGSNIANILSQYDEQYSYDIETAYIINSNAYLEYNFTNSNLLLTDSSPYAKNIINYGGYYVSNSNINCLFLDSSNYATFNENNWLYQSNLTIAGWFKTDGFQDGDEIFDLNYQTVNHPVISPYIQPVQINKNEYYVAFTNTSSTSTIIFPKATKCDILVIGGGGGGGGDIGGGGGAGGVVYQKGVILASGTYTITVGLGGAVRSASAVNTNNSVNGNN